MTLNLQRRNQQIASSVGREWSNDRDAERQQKMVIIRNNYMQKLNENSQAVQRNKIKIEQL